VPALHLDDDAPRVAAVVIEEDDRAIDALVRALLRVASGPRADQPERPVLELALSP
jgi:hypothetical protein